MALNFPTNTGAPYIDPTTGLKYIYNTAVGAWESALQPPVIVKNSAPTTAIEGFLWFNILDNTLYVYRAGAWNAVSSATSSGADVRVSDSPAALPSVGDLWWDTVEGQLFIYFTDADGGSAWMPCSPTIAASGGGAFVSASSPPTQTQGGLWFNTTTNTLNVYNGTSWVPALNEVSGVNAINGTTPVTVDNTDPSQPVLGISPATSSANGSIRLGTQAEVNAATETSVAITPATLNAGIGNYLPDASDVAKGAVELATQAEVEAGTDTTRAVTPAALAAAVPAIGLAVPAGTVIAFAGAATPAGYLLCDGSQQSRTTYAALFAVVGTTYGAGDGSTTFNLPDLRGEFVRGLDSGRGVDSGRALGSFQADEIKAHTHTVTTGGTGSAIDGGGDRDSDDGTQATSSFGGVETRPRNIAMNYIVKV